MLHKIKTKLNERKAKRMVAESAPSAFDDAEISWVAPEYIKHDRGLLWKISAVLVVLIAAGFGIMYNAWTFSLAIVAFAVAYSLVRLEHPRDVDVKISNVGIKIGAKKIPYSRIRAFWVIYEPPFIQTFNIRVSGDLLLDISIQMNGQDPAKLREFLLSKIPEMEGKGESLSDALLRLFKI